MLTLGSVDIPTYNNLLSTLKAKNPDIQGVDAPYVVITRVNNYQAIILQGEFKKQTYILHLVEIQAPQSEKKNLQPIPKYLWESAQDEVIRTLNSIWETKT
jgi:hypothetical protein